MFRTSARWRGIAGRARRDRQGVVAFSKQLRNPVEDQAPWLQALGRAVGENLDDVAIRLDDLECCLHRAPLKMAQFIVDEGVSLWREPIQGPVRQRGALADTPSLLPPWKGPAENPQCCSRRKSYLVGGATVSRSDFSSAESAFTASPGTENHLTPSNAMSRVVRRESTCPNHDSSGWVRQVYNRQKVRATHPIPRRPVSRKAANYPKPSFQLAGGQVEFAQSGLAYATAHKPRLCAIPHDLIEQPSRKLFFQKLD